MLQQLTSSLIQEISKVKESDIAESTAACLTHLSGDVAPNPIGILLPLLHPTVRLDEPCVMSEIPDLSVLKLAFSLTDSTSHKRKGDTNEQQSPPPPSQRRKI